MEGSGLYLISTVVDKKHKLCHTWGSGLYLISTVVDRIVLSWPVQLVQACI